MENMHHAIKTGLLVFKPKKPRIKKLTKGTTIRKVNQYDLNGNLVCTYNSAKEATLDGKFTTAGISMACNGKLKKHRKFIWEFGESYTSTWLK